MLGGYAPELRRDVVRPEEAWLLDASAPWIAGLDVPVRARLGQREDAAAILDRYLAAYAAAPLPLPEFAAADSARYGAGQTPDAGRSWDNAAWFAIVYGGHYGLEPTPAALRIHPAPLRAIADDSVTGYRYGKARITLTLRDGAYTVQADQPCALTLLPMGADTGISLDGGPTAPSATVQARPGRTYTVQSSRQAAAPAPAPTQRQNPPATGTPTATPTATPTPSPAATSTPTAPAPSPTPTPEASPAEPEAAPPTPEPQPEPPAPPAPSPPPPPARAFQATDRVGAPTPVNLRSGPGADYPTQGSLAPGTLLAATGESSQAGGFLWRRFLVEDGRTGWIRDVDVQPLDR